MFDLRTLRIKYGLSQDELASEMDCNRSTIAMIETGKNEPSIKLAKKLAKYFDVDWTVFFKD